MKYKGYNDVKKYVRSNKILCPEAKNAYLESSYFTLKKLNSNFAWGVFTWILEVLLIKKQIFK